MYQIERDALCERGLFWPSRKIDKALIVKNAMSFKIIGKRAKDDAWRVRMRNKDLLAKYNELLPENLQNFKLNSWQQLDQYSLRELQEIFDYFINKMMEEPLTPDGELNANGILLDDLAGKINVVIIQKKV